MGKGAIPFFLPTAREAMHHSDKQSHLRPRPSPGPPVGEFLLSDRTIGAYM